MGKINDNVVVDGEDYGEACENLFLKYGDDQDIETIKQFCEQYIESYERLTALCNRLIVEVSKMGIDVDNLLDKIENK